MKVIETEIAGVKIIEPDVFGDTRGLLYCRIKTLVFRCLRTYNLTKRKTNESMPG